MTSSPKSIIRVVLSACAIQCSIVGVSAGAAARLDPVEVLTYPNRPIRVIVPSPPQGGADLLARALVDPLRESLRQRIIVENRVGAGGNAGAAVVAASPADGHMLLVSASDTHVINPILYGAKMAFRGIDDFEPIALLAYSDLALAVHPSVSAVSVTDLVAMARAKPGQLRVATSGASSRGHLLALIFEKREAIEIRLVPFTGSAPAAKAVAGGLAEAVFGSYSSMAAYVRANKLRLLAISNRRGETSMPVLDQSFASFELELYYGLLAPKNTPREIIERVNLHVNRALELPRIQARLSSMGLDPDPGSAESLGRKMRVDSVRWTHTLAGFTIAPD